jgi:replicative DNA helicase
VTKEEEQSYHRMFLSYLIDLEGSTDIQFMHKLMERKFIPDMLKRYDTDIAGWVSTPAELILKDILAYFVSNRMLPTKEILLFRISNGEIPLKNKAECVSELQIISAPSIMRDSEFLWLLSTITQRYMQHFLWATIWAGGGALEHGKVDEALAIFHQKIIQLEDLKTSKIPPQSMKGIIEELYNNYGTEPEYCIPSGIYDWDSVAGGFYPGDLIIVAARPKCGKTTLSKEILRNAYHQGYTGAFFSREMGANPIGRRWLAAELDVQERIIRNRQLDDSVLNNWKKIVQEYKDKVNDIYFIGPGQCANPALIDMELENIANKGPLHIAVIDFLGMLEPSSSVIDYARDERVGAIVADIKKSAIRFNIPIILVCQINRAGEDTLEPDLTLLADSDKIGQYADLIWMMVKDKAMPMRMKVRAIPRNEEQIDFYLRFNRPMLKFARWIDNYEQFTES